MRKLLGHLCLLTLIASLFFVASVEAQNTSTTRRISSPQRYEVQSETTLKGIVQNVISTPTAGLLAGVHLMLSTSSGTVDACLGPFAPRGKNPVSVSTGESVQVVGVMMTVRGKQVFITRTVSAGSQTYIIRNQNGFPLLPSNDTAPASFANGGPR